MGVIGIMAPGFSSYLMNNGYQFEKVVCTREGVQDTYSTTAFSIQINVSLEYCILNFSKQKKLSGGQVDQDGCNLAKMDGEGKVFNRDTLEEVVLQWKAMYIKLAKL